MPATTSDSWRTWLVTGTRLVPLDVRRARGASGRLKETLIDSPGAAAEDRSRWRNFSSAMDRQAVGEALNALPLQQREVVKLAYFGGMTNREIADRLGVPVGGVRHRLRQALAAAGEYVDRGRATGPRVLYGLIAWLCGRSFENTHRSSGAGVEQVLRAGMVVAAGVSASAMLGIANLPVQPANIERANPTSVTSLEASAAVPPKRTVPAATALPQAPVVSAGVNQAANVASVAVTVIAPISVIGLPTPVAALPIPVNVPIPLPVPIPTPTHPPLP